MTKDPEMANIKTIPENVQRTLTKENHLQQILRTTRTTSGFSSLHHHLLLEGKTAPTFMVLPLWIFQLVTLPT